MKKALGYVFAALSFLFFIFAVGTFGSLDNGDISFFEAIAECVIFLVVSVFCGKISGM